MTGDVLLIGLFMLIKRSPMIVLLPVVLLVATFFEFTSPFPSFLMFLIVFVSVALSLWLLYIMHASFFSRIVATGVGIVSFDLLSIVILGSVERAGFGSIVMLFLGTAVFHLFFLAVFEAVFAIIYKIIYAIRWKKKTSRFLEARF